MMRFLKRRFWGKPNLNADWESALRDYSRHLETILPNLPPSAVLLENHATRRPFHDATIERIDRVSPRQLNIELDDRRIELLEVRQVDVPDGFTESEWMYSELDLFGGNGMVLRVAYWEEGVLGEMSFAAAACRLFDKQLNRYLIPEEPAPPPPTLFLNPNRNRGHGRQHREKRR
jgi:hypothetical protein